MLNKQLTGGLSHDRQGGDEGILVVFEPRNARGEMVAEPGDVSIALVDPERSGPQARIARWDFAANEAFEQFHRSGALGRGYEFELPWPDAAPQNKKLELFVRYVTPDGRKLMSEMTISVDPPAGNQAKRWRTPAGGMADPSRSAASAPPDATAQSDRSTSAVSAGRAPTAASRDTEAPRFSGQAPEQTAPKGNRAQGRARRRVGTRRGEGPAIARPDEEARPRSPAGRHGLPIAEQTLGPRGPPMQALRLRCRQCTRWPGLAPESGASRKISLPPAPAATTIPSLRPKVICRGSRLATTTTSRPTNCAGS